MDVQSKRVKTGITGLDDMLSGGIPHASQVILAGGPGAGKTLLSFEFLYRNAKLGNKGILFALEEDGDKLMSNIKATFSQFQDINDLIEKRMIIIDGRSPDSELSDKSAESEYEFGKIISDMESVILAEGANLIVIDSSSVLDLLVQTPLAYRRMMLSLSSNFRRLGVTSILVSETYNPERSKLEFRPEYFLFDGIIMMYQMENELRRMFGLEVIKMRGTKHSFYTAPYDITSSGVKVFSTTIDQPDTK